MTKQEQVVYSSLNTFYDFDNKYLVHLIPIFKHDNWYRFVIIHPDLFQARSIGSYFVFYLWEDGDDRKVFSDEYTTCSCFVIIIYWIFFFRYSRGKGKQ